jgi:hypothetical protein
MVAMPRVPVRREKRSAPAPSAERATATATAAGTAAAESRGFAPDRYGATSADRYGSTSADRYSQDRYGSDRYDGYGTDERRYQADRSAVPVEDRYGQSADDLAAAAGRGRTNGTSSRANGSGQPTNGTAAENDPAVEAATDEPTRRITRPAVD